MLLALKVCVTFGVSTIMCKNSFSTLIHHGAELNTGGPEELQADVRGEVEVCGMIS